MGLQEVLDSMIAVKRAEEMKTSPQLTLGELILKLGAIKRKDLPVVFDIKKYHPTGIGSWRGSYCELALEYSDSKVKLTCIELLKILRPYIGATLSGYKGGEYLMGKTTPVWVANYGESCGFRQKDDYEENYTAVINVAEDENYIIIKTRALDYLI